METIVSKAEEDIPLRVSVPIIVCALPAPRVSVQAEVACFCRWKKVFDPVMVWLDEVDNTTVLWLALNVPPRFVQSPMTLMLEAVGTLRVAPESITTLLSDRMEDTILVFPANSIVPPCAERVPLLVRLPPIFKVSPTTNVAVLAMVRLFAMAMELSKV